MPDVESQIGELSNQMDAVYVWYCDLFNSANNLPLVLNLSPFHIIISKP